jgi:hypothetical protein
VKAGDELEAVTVVADNDRDEDALQLDPAPRGAMRKEMTDDNNISSVLVGMPAPG